MMRACKQTLAAILLTLVILLMGAAAGWSAGLEADMVIYNGKILTMDSPDPGSYRIVKAAAIYEGKFIVVGTDDEALQYAGPKTQKIDLAGRTVIPGLMETHSHIQGFGLPYVPPQQRLRGDPAIVWNNKAEGLAQLRTRAMEKKPGEWISTSARAGMGGQGNNNPNTGLEFPIGVKKGEITRFDLDAVTPNNPVRFSSIFFSPTGDSFANTKALEPILARYGKDLPGIHKDAKGVPTGWLSGVADHLIEYEFMPLTPPETLAPIMKVGMELMAAEGITTDSTRLSPQQIAGYAWLHANDELPIRLGFSLEASARSADPYAIEARLVGLQGASANRVWGLGDDKLWMIGLSPISIDSVPNVGGSCTTKTYPREAVNFPLWMQQFYGPNGLCRLEDPNYRSADELRAAALYGFRIAGMHTGGDRGINDILDILEEASKTNPNLPQARWSLDHCRFLDDKEAERAKKFNLVFSCGPKYVYSGDKGDIGAYKILYGPEIAADVVVSMKRMLDHGLRVAMELDQKSFYSFLAMETAITRKDINGKVWGPQQRISRLQALYSYTRWSAEYFLKEKVLGSIEPKKLADFVVLDRDFLSTPEDEIGQIDPLLTVVGGKIAYSQPEFARSMGLPVVGFQADRSFWLRGTPEDLNRKSDDSSDGSGALSNGG